MARRKRPVDPLNCLFTPSNIPDTPPTTPRPLTPPAWPSPRGYEVLAQLDSAIGGLAALAYADMLAADNNLVRDHAGAELLSELVLSAFALGLHLEQHNPERAKAIQKAITAARSEAGRRARRARDIVDAAKRGAICDLWASGKYSSRGVCVEQECAGLAMSPDTARKALVNTPDPDPWPAKNKHSRLRKK